MLKQLVPRIFKFWALHLLMVVAGMLAMAITGPIQSAFSPGLAALVSLLVSLVVTVIYYLVFVRASRKLLRSVKEGFLFSFAGALPMFLVILGAIIYLKKVPHNTIGYGFILLPVTLPFQGWIEQVFPALPFHILALAIPAVFMAAILRGSSSHPKR
jgi:hypothetical protein